MLRFDFREYYFGRELGRLLKFLLTVLNIMIEGPQSHPEPYQSHSCS